ncbi:hypothetical protein [Pseudanabaena sp. PCC 6802]|uniref:hypothetical protein n=1 Tax=Pseudanabaena sp. PCC 6802 TaxID=118173 RepID=UPI00034D0726|nr:hypothetical protein [Pseudanabaena sp. PCC 6802]
MKTAVAGSGGVRSPPKVVVGAIGATGLKGRLAYGSFAYAELPSTSPNPALRLSVVVGRSLAKGGVLALVLPNSLGMVTDVYNHPKGTAAGTSTGNLWRNYIGRSG